MEFIQSWVRGLVTLAVLVGFVELMLPQDGFKPYVRMVLGLLVVVALIRPLIQRLPEWQSVEWAMAEKSHRVEQVIVMGETIRQRGAAAASRLLPAEQQLEAELKRRIPEIYDLHIKRRVDGGYRIFIHGSKKEELLDKVWRELNAMGWNEDRVEVMMDGG